MRLPAGLLLAAVVVNPTAVLHAHPVPRKSHDRTVLVRLMADPGRQELRVVAEYRLDVDELTVVFDDLPAVSDKVDLSQFHQADQLYEAYTQAYAPILAANLLATLDGRPLEFRCLRSSHTLRDDDGTPLGHLRCQFVFESGPHPLMDALQVACCWPGPGVQPTSVLGDFYRLGSHHFTFKESNYELEEGMIGLALAADATVQLYGKVEPGTALQSRPASELGPGDDARLRTARTYFSLVPFSNLPPGGRQSSVATAVSSDPVSPQPPATTQAGTNRHSLLALLLDSQKGLFALLLLAAGFGAAHALTPGHGKTLVAAYLVGERGTVWHALVLGLVTTLTHTGVVLVLAGVLFAFFPRVVPAQVQVLFGLTGGLLIAGLGFWLLLRRLSGGADHVHIGGHGHHHHHEGGHHDHHGQDFADHYHDENGHAHALPAAGAAVGWWGLIILGMSGGIVPCWDAIIMLGLAISAQRIWLGLPLLLAFSAGLALVLIVIGMAVVCISGFAASRLGSGRIIRALPLASAVLVMGMGLWLCYDSLHPETKSPVPLEQLRR